MDFWILLTICFTGGILPALIWLFFWLKHDEKHPEPNRLILLTFILGMSVVPVVAIFQRITGFVLIGTTNLYPIFVVNILMATLTIVAWATTEEILKYVAAYLGGLSQKENDEPIDPSVYLITAALGFAALENTMYLLGPVFETDTTRALLTLNTRFIGSTLIHVSSSAIIGVFLGLSYYKSQLTRKRYLASGMILAIGLHSAFNFFIMKEGNFTMVAFFITWISVIVIIAFLERIKHRVSEPK